MGLVETSPGVRRHVVGPQATENSWIPSRASAVLYRDPETPSAICCSLAFGDRTSQTNTVDDVNPAWLGILKYTKTLGTTCGSIVHQYMI